MVGNKRSIIYKKIGGFIMVQWIKKLFPMNDFERMCKDLEDEFSESSNMSSPKCLKKYNLAKDMIEKKIL